MKEINNLPLFCPDATRGVIRSLDSQDLYNVGTKAIVVNTFHLLSKPNPENLIKLGGIKKFMNYNGLVISDSGGFQIFSLIQRDKKLGKIHADGVEFYINTSGKMEKYYLTPKKCLEIQLAIDSDILVGLDYFTPFNANKYQIDLSIEKTVEWGKQFMDKFVELPAVIKENKMLVGVVQGDKSVSARYDCADKLAEIGYDIFGLGGWVFKEEGVLNDEVCIAMADKAKEHKKIAYAMGIGNPYDIVKCLNWGYELFDVVLPTRDARHARLYAFNKEPNWENLLNLDFYEYVYPKKAKYLNSTSPISQYCNCHTCKNYSMGYLHHLFKIGDSLAHRLATIHNLCFYNKIIESYKKYHNTNSSYNV